MAQDDIRPTDAGFVGPQIDVEFKPSLDGSSFDAWRQHLSWSGTIDLLDQADRAAFHARVRIFYCGDFLFSESSSSHPQRLVRTAKDVARTDTDLINISLYLEGTWRGRCGARSIIAGPGDVSFVDFGSPFEFELSPYRSFALTVPRSKLPDHLATRDLHGIVPAAGRPMTALLAHVLRAMTDTMQYLTAVEGVAAASAILDLASALSEFGQPRRDDKPSGVALRERLQIYIEDNLGLSDLTPVRLCEALQISRTSLFRVFANDGGVGAYIKERRLQRCYEIIRTDHDAQDKLGSIAFAAGFNSEAHFSRAFKERFGMSPREMRDIARSRTVGIETPAATGMMPHILRTLGK